MIFQVQLELYHPGCCDPVLCCVLQLIYVFGSGVSYVLLDSTSQLFCEVLSSTNLNLT